jgi:hypothetical protein
MLSFKKCYCCGETKETVFFGKNKSKKDGLTSECKSCKAKTDKEYYKKNTQKVKEKAASWYSENKEQALVRMKAISQKWAKENKEKRADTEAKRRANKLLATPCWLSEAQLREIETEYALSAWCSTVMDSSYHVDHIVPLKGKLVCGLHVPWNLRVIPASENISKGNRYAI